MAKPGERVKLATLHDVYVRDGNRIDVRSIRPERGWESIINGWYISYEQPPRGELARRGFYAANGDGFVGKSIPACQAPFEGYFASDVSNIFKIVAAGASARVDDQMSMVDNAACIILELTSPDYGNYRIWIDPSAGYLPRKAVVVKKGRNYWVASRIDQQTRLHPKGSRGTVLTKEISWNMDNVQLNQRDGKWFVSNSRLVQMRSYVDGNVQTITSVWRRTKLDPGPPQPGVVSFIPDLREGAPLSNQDDQHIPYEWRGGAPVPRVDPAVKQQLDRSAEQLAGRSTNH